jgi:hypothetical protein
MMSTEGSSGVPATALEAGTPETEISATPEAIATPQPAVAKETITPRDLSRARKQAKQIEELNTKVAELAGSLSRVENQQAESAMHVEDHLRETEAQLQAQLQTQIAQLQAQLQTQIAQLQAPVSQLQAKPKSRPAAKKPAKKSSPAKSAKKKKKAAKKKR